MQNPYEVLGLPSSATEEQIIAAYKTLKERYLEERFLEGEKGNLAAKRLTELEQAYSEIMSFRKQSFDSGNKSEAFVEVEKALKAGDFTAAQHKLDEFNERGAEWHYLQSVVFYKKNWTNESKKQLELALRLEPSNAKYKDAYEKLEAQMNFDGRAFTSGNAKAAGGEYENPRQMGGDSCTDAANCCSTMMCMNCLMNCCCGCR